MTERIALLDNAVALAVSGYLTSAVIATVFAIF